MRPADGDSDQLKEALENSEPTAGDVGQSHNKRQRLTDISPSVSSSSRITATRKDVVVGFRKDLEKIKFWLTEMRSTGLQVLSIVGVGGAGKTTLAKLVYNDELLVKHFDIRAWVTVSQGYSVGSILSNLLASLERQFPSIRYEKREISTESLIGKHLRRGRFLIVIDDMCSKKAWDEIKMIFSNISYRSRIVLTTRLHEVAAYVDYFSAVHTMRLLDAHHSWNLLERKVFVDELCPFELEEVGKQIVKNCGGLPLTIVLVAGILSKVPKTRDSWKSIAENHSGTDAVLSLSYNHLPEYMRQCFLYMGGYPEDYWIRASELIKLWIAEGFLKCLTGSKSQEEEAARVLENLVERNLVLVSRKKYGVKARSCNLHDMVRDFCIKQSQHEKFLISVMDFLPTPILRRHFLPQLLENYDRISVASHNLNLRDYTHSSCTHSIICFPQGGFRCVCYMNKFTSLRVFHVIRRNEYWKLKPSHILYLIDLTYLASNIPTSIVPPTISKLQNLQTLIIYRSNVVFPVEIWMLRKLRHLRAFSFNSLPCPDEATLPLENLETMSVVKDFVCGERMMKMIPNIKKLGICYFMSNYSLHNLANIWTMSTVKEDYGLHNPGNIWTMPPVKMSSNIMELGTHETMWVDYYALHNLRHLCRLEKLKLKAKSPMGVQNHTIGAHPDFVLPLSLKRLTLCRLKLSWGDMRIIGSLPNLQVLKLRNNACSGYHWITNDDEFGELRFLLIDGSNLMYWRAKGFNFRRLECLTLLNCPYLKEIPAGEIGRIPTLNLVEMDTKSAHFSLTLQQIRKMSGNDSFKVRVRRS